MTLHLLNVAFFAGHNLLIAFNLCGWIWKPSRRLHLFTVGSTLFSWFVMGAWYGWGYCLCTDWHFRIRREIGFHDRATSYAELLLNSMPGISVSRGIADGITATTFALILIVTAVVWLRADLRTTQSILYPIRTDQERN